MIQRCPKCGKPTRYTKHASRKRQQKGYCLMCWHEHLETKSWDNLFRESNRMYEVPVSSWEI